MYAKHFFRTRGNSACTHLALGIRFRFRLYAKYAQQPEVGLGRPRRRAGPRKEDY